MQLALPISVAIAATSFTATNIAAFTPFAAHTSRSASVHVCAKNAFTVLSAAEGEGEDKKSQETETPEAAPKKEDEQVGDRLILAPFLEALDPMWKCRGPVGEEDFLLSRTGGPTDEELTNENIYKILKIECNDLEVNTLMWKCLGYRFNEEKEEWEATEVFPKWKGNYPTPPDMLGMARIYSREVDKVSLKANQSVVRSIPRDHKQSLKTILRPLGFTGYKIAELTPNKTRRAQCANWLLYYRENLYGYTIEELKEQRRLKNEAIQAEKDRIEKETGEKPEDERNPPVKQVF